MRQLLPIAFISLLPTCALCEDYLFPDNLWEIEYIWDSELIQAAANDITDISANDTKNLMQCYNKNLDDGKISFMNILVKCCVQCAKINSDTCIDLGAYIVTYHHQYDKLRIVAPAQHVQQTIHDEFETSQSSGNSTPQPSPDDRKTTDERGQCKVILGTNTINELRRSPQTAANTTGLINRTRTLIQKFCKTPTGQFSTDSVIDSSHMDYAPGKAYIICKQGCKE